MHTLIGLILLKANAFDRRDSMNVPGVNQRVFSRGCCPRAVLGLIFLVVSLNQLILVILQSIRIANNKNHSSRAGS